MPNNLIPGQKPLKFVRSIPASRSKKVSPFIKTITLIFDKNVVNNSVWDKNRTMITMFAGDRKIPIKVVRIPDTVDFSQRQKIFVKPQVTLDSFTKFTIRISAGLTAKNGEKLGKTVLVTFTTGSKGK
ncbi:Ig-like domain-containing protein [Syntrophomonas erecta]